MISFFMIFLRSEVCFGLKANLARLIVSRTLGVSIFPVRYQAHPSAPQNHLD
jgi:hypothetical protein